MDKIVRIQEKVLDHLLDVYDSNRDFFFVPRKINNKQRLDKGYWFIGNEHYLYLSFWDGTDWKEKVHNIGFVVLKDGSSYIELSAQDSKTKAEFLSKIPIKISGFKKDKSKSKWYKYFSDKNYLDNIDLFINDYKPIIDELVVKYSPEGIKVLDRTFFNKYIKDIILRRKKQISFGKNNKLSRICWNTTNWKYPSGALGKSNDTGSYEATSGFGHEEWLFDKSRIINGYHYAFLQPLFLKSDRHEGKTYNIELFTINNLNEKYYVGYLKDVECISKQDSSEIYHIYKENGWLRDMENDIKRAGASLELFKDTAPQNFFNIRFKFANITRPDDLVKLSNEDINITTNRYKLLPQKTDLLFETIDDQDNDDLGKKRNTKKRKKVFNGECEYDPYHDQMQNAIFDLLTKNKATLEYEKVFIEKGRVDIKAKTIRGSWHYFEIKTDNPKQSIRNALGQILEYAFFPNVEKAEKLIIVADSEPNGDIINYLSFIREKFNLPVYYRYFILEQNKMSNDY